MVLLQCWVLDMLLLQRRTSVSRSPECWKLKIQLAAKEGLALINGTTVLTGIGALYPMMVSNCSNSLISLVLSMGSPQWGLPVRPEEESFHTILVLKVDNCNCSHIRNSLKGSKNTTVATQQGVQDPYTPAVFPKFMEPARIQSLM